MDAAPTCGAWLSIASLEGYHDDGLNRNISTHGRYRDGEKPDCSLCQRTDDTGEGEAPKEGERRGEGEKNMQG